MSTLKRLANLARGGFLVWQRGPRPQAPLTAEELAPRRRPQVDDDDDDEVESNVAVAEDVEPGVRPEVPVTPRKRRL